MPDTSKEVSAIKGKDADQQYTNKMSTLLTEEMERFIEQHFNRRTKLWFIVNVATPETNLQDLNDEQLDLIAKHLKCVDIATIRLRKLDLTEACKLNVRRYKSMIQQNQEFFLSKWGSDEQRLKYTPIVLRRLFKDELIIQYHEGANIVDKTLSSKQSLANVILTEKLYQEFLHFGITTAIDSPQVVYHDGDHFTFVPEQEVEVTYKDCLCVDKLEQGNPHTIEQIMGGACPNVETNVVKELVPQLKHNVGSWNCNGCLVNGGRGSIQATQSETHSEPFVKATKWCPNFLAGGMGPMLAAHGVERWYNAIAGKVEKLCFAGIMHIQVTPQPEKHSVKMDYKCDTCGLLVSEELAAVMDEDKDIDIRETMNSIAETEEIKTVEENIDTE